MEAPGQRFLQRTQRMVSTFSGGTIMDQVWKNWLGHKPVLQCLQEIDAWISEGLFEDRKTAFLAIANALVSRSRVRLSFLD
jgi:hypothetical protein